MLTSWPVYSGWNVPTFQRYFFHENLKPLTVHSFDGVFKQFPSAVVTYAFRNTYRTLPVANLGLARTSGWNRSRFFYRCDKTFCFKWNHVHGRLFHRNAFPNATCFIFGTVRWPLSGWRGQWNTKEHTSLWARAARQPDGHQSSSAIPIKCRNHGSRLQDFLQWEINNWGGESELGVLTSKKTTFQIIQHFQYIFTSQGLKPLWLQLDS